MELNCILSPRSRGLRPTHQHIDLSQILWMRTIYGSSFFSANHWVQFIFDRFALTLYNCWIFPGQSVLDHETMNREALESNLVSPIRLNWEHVDQSLKGGDNLQYEMIKCRSGATKVLYRATWKQEGKNVKWILFVCFERQTNKEKDLKTTRCVGGLIIPNSWSHSECKSSSLFQRNTTWSRIESCGFQKYQFSQDGGWESKVALSSSPRSSPFWPSWSPTWNGDRLLSQSSF